MNIALLGYGKMGKTIERIALERGHRIVLKTDSKNSTIDLSQTDVAIEFSFPNIAANNISACIEAGIPVVSGTTGWLDRYDEIIKLCENRNGSFIYASNFSVGVNLFFSINEYVSKLMNPMPDYAVGIEEIHHTQKKDAPSGTAISLAEGIISNTGKKDWELEKGLKVMEDSIAIKAKRIDDVKGTHVVSYASEVDTISIKHEAHSRDGFALGAIIAAEWLRNKKGVYTMKDVLKIDTV